MFVEISEKKMLLELFKALFLSVEEAYAWAGVHSSQLYGDA